MTESVEVVVRLPADLVRDTREFDLLTDEMIALLLREALERRVNALVSEEIEAYRSEKYANRKLKEQQK